MITHEQWESNIDIETESQKPDPEPERVTPGEYIGKISGVDYIFAQSGNPGYLISFDCVGVPEGGNTKVGKFTQRLWLSEKAQRLGIIPLCRAVSYLPAHKQFQPLELVGRYCRLLVKYRKAQNGETSTWPEIDVFGWGEFHGVRPVDERDTEYFLATMQAGTEAGTDTPELVDDIPF